MINVLVIEDDIKLNKLFCATLQHSNFNTFSSYDGEEAMDILDKEHVDLILTDIMMPNMDGFEFVKLLREAEYNIPILMITAKDSFEDKEQGFEIGIDDYMVKPIDVHEMVLRVNALMRRAKIANVKEIVFENTKLNNDSLTISFNEEEVLLPQKEFSLLYKLASYPNKIFTRQQLMNEIWGLDSETDERTVDVHINRLRDRLKSSNDIKITTVRGLGYKLEKKI